MKKLFTVLAALLMGEIAGLAPAHAGVQFEITGDGNGINRFYLSIGDYFGVPQNQISVIRQRHIADEQIPVVLFIAQKARVAPGRVMLLRERGLTWMQVAWKLGLGPEVFHVTINNVSGSPYAKPYGYYQRYHRSRWRQIRLSDADIVNFVNLRFISDKYRCRPDEVVAMRTQGRSFVNINEDWRARTAPPQAFRPGQPDPAPQYAKKSQGRGNDRPGHQHNSRHYR